MSLFSVWFGCVSSSLGEQKGRKTRGGESSYPFVYSLNGEGSSNIAVQQKHVVPQHKIRNKENKNYINKKVLIYL